MHVQYASLTGLHGIAARRNTTTTILALAQCHSLSYCRKKIELIAVNVSILEYQSSLIQLKNTLKYPFHCSPDALVECVGG